MNEQFASSLLVEVEGTPLPADVAGLLAYAYVDDSRNLPDVCVLRFRDPQRVVLAKAGFRIGAQLRLRVQTSDPEGPVELMAGEVTAVERELDRTGTVTEVRGMDHAHRLFRGRRVAAYPNMTVADVVRAVAQRAGLSLGRIDNVPGVGTGQHEQLSQDNVSDWEFLTRLADLVGAQVMVRDSQLEFRLPQPPADAPDPSTRATADPHVLEVNRNLVSLRAGVTAAEQVPEVTVRGWDPAAKRPVTATAAAAGPETQAGADPASVAGTMGAPPYLVATPAVDREPTATAAATALAGHIGGSLVELEGVAKGNPRLRAGTAVALANVGEPFEGRYTLTSTRHLFSEQAGYTTAFTVAGRQERSLYGLAAGGRPALRPGSQLGVVPAVVSDIRDPLGLGRVRVTFPWLDPDFTSGWARTTQAGAGRGRGAVVLPEVGDEVLVGFAHGDLDRPYVLGGLHSDPDPLPDLAVAPVDGTSGQVAVRGFVSRTGHRLELAEGNGADQVLVATGGDGLLLRLDKAGRLVQLVSDGEVTVTAARGITIDAGAGALKLSGQSVALTATGGDVSVEAATNLKLSGRTGATMEAATVKVSGQGQAELTASGTVTVRGGMVRIN